MEYEDYQYNQGLPNQIGEHPKKEKCNISGTWVSDIDEILQASVPLMFLIAATIGVGFIVFNENLRENLVLTNFISGSLGAATMAAKNKSN